MLPGFQELKIQHQRRVRKTYKIDAKKARTISSLDMVLLDAILRPQHHEERTCRKRHKDAVS
jgi:hypothetical protein